MSELIAKEYKRFEDIKKCEMTVRNIGVQENSLWHVITQNGKIFIR